MKQKRRRLIWLACSLCGRQSQVPRKGRAPEQRQARRVCGHCRRSGEKALRED